MAAFAGGGAIVFLLLWVPVLVSHWHSFREQVLSYKELVTLKTRYVDPMPGWCRHGRLHAQILYTRTDTGRLAAKHPNVLAFPKHSDLGLLVRRGFVAPRARRSAARSATGWRRCHCWRLAAPACQARSGR